MLGEIGHIDVFGTDYPTPDGTAMRDYIHVRDLVGAHIDVLAYLEKGGKSDIFNVGYGQGYSVLEVIAAAEKILGKRITQVNRPRRKGDSMAVIGANDKLVRATNWRPQFPSLGGMVCDEYDWVKVQKALRT
jgi:UDP-glucose 4-epimerase